METFCTNYFDFFKQIFCKSWYVLSQIEVFIQEKIIEIFIFEWNIKKCKNPPTNHSKRLQLMTFSIKCFLSILLLVFNQCDHVGLFLKVIRDKFSFQINWNIWWPFELFWKTWLLSKNCFGYFLGNIWKIGLLFILASDHTDPNRVSNFDFFYLPRWKF